MVRCLTAIVGGRSVQYKVVVQQASISKLQGVSTMMMMTMIGSFAVMYQMVGGVWVETTRHSVKCYGKPSSTSVAHAWLEREHEELVQLIAERQELEELTTAGELIEDGIGFGMEAAERDGEFDEEVVSWAAYKMMHGRSGIDLTGKVKTMEYRPNPSELNSYNWDITKVPATKLRLPTDIRRCYVQQGPDMEVNDIEPLSSAEVLDLEDNRLQLTDVHELVKRLEYGMWKLRGFEDQLGVGEAEDGTVTTLEMVVAGHILGCDIFDEQVEQLRRARLRGVSDNWSYTDRFMMGEREGITVSEDTQNDIDYTKFQQFNEPDYGEMLDAMCASLERVKKNIPARTRNYLRCFYKVGEKVRPKKNQDGSLVTDAKGDIVWELAVSGQMRYDGEYHKYIRRCEQERNDRFASLAQLLQKLTPERAIRKMSEINDKYKASVASCKPGPRSAKDSAGKWTTQPHVGKYAIKELLARGYKLDQLVTRKKGSAKPNERELKLAVLEKVKARITFGVGERWHKLYLKKEHLSQLQAIVDAKSANIWDDFDAEMDAHELVNTSVVQSGLDENYLAQEFGYGEENWEFWETQMQTMHETLNRG